MKLVLTLLVRDEADILAANLDFHLAQGVDFIIAMDNLSIDATAEILERYRRLGVLHYIHQPDDDYAQRRWVTRMARLAATRFGADWVINGDADEFWWPERGDLRSTLSAVASEIEALAAPRVNFGGDPRSPAASFFADRMILRDERSTDPFGLPLRPKVCHRGFADVRIAQGNHRARREGGTLVTAPAPIRILHFPMRSAAQFANKIAKGGAAYARNARLDVGLGITWRRLYEEHWRAGTLDRYYDSQLPIETEIASGRYVVDTRLRDFLAALPPRAPG